MGQFKPMVKMMTTEPSVELKLKKGGKVEKKMQMGGDPMAAAPSMPARGGALTGAAPMKPSLAMRRKAMRAMPPGAAPAGPVGQAGRMMKEGGESKSMHASEMKKMAKTAADLKKHADKPASKAHKGLKKGGMACATGGVANGQGGYKKGGIINTENQGGEYRNTKMDTAEYTGKSGNKTGGVKMGNGGGYKKGGAACYATGGVAKANGGGYKKGGATKKFADGGMTGYAPVSEEERQLAAEVLGPGAMSDEERRYLQQEMLKEMKRPHNQMRPEGNVTEVEREVVRKIPMKRPEPQIKGPARKYAQGGAVNDSGKAEKMPARRVPTPVSINQLSGTYKKGGMVMTPAQKRLSKTFDSENAPAMKAAKKMTNEKYGRK
jgi:polyhydroxyalkanoate synthesis regulator phasin